MSKYRPYAKAVAYYDLVMCIISILFQIEIVARGKAIYSIHIPNTAIEIVIAVVVSVVIVATLWMWAAIGLLSATKFGRDPVEAVRWTTFWMIINIVILLFVISFFRVLDSGLYVPIAAQAVVRMGTMYIVFRYRQELKMMIPGVSVSVAA